MLAERLRRLGQDHIADILEDESRRHEAMRIESDLGGVDLDLVERIMRGEGLAEVPPSEVRPAPVVPASFSSSPSAAQCVLAGRRLLEQGKVAALIVAGGQASRLGVESPKGCVEVTPLTGKTLFRVFAEQILALGRRFGRPVPWFIMTSPVNHAQTVEYFTANDFLGLNPRMVFFFPQGVLPSLTGEGKFILAPEGGLFLNPDGHGGVFRALLTSGMFDAMRDLGIEEIFTFQVDNPLVKVCDPLFVGLHSMQGACMSSKVVRKAGFDEKVGVMVEYGGRTRLLEYSDMDDAIRYATDENGEMLHWAGSIAIHLMRLDFAREVASRSHALPFHRAVKKIPALAPDGTTVTVEGIKFETFIFDALAHARTSVTLEVTRSEEFAPVKNLTGTDSLETSRVLQSKRHVSWLRAIGVDVRDGVTVEISPLFALDREELASRRAEIGDVITRDTYLG